MNNVDAAFQHDLDGLVGSQELVRIRHRAPGKLPQALLVNLSVKNEGVPVADGGAIALPHYEAVLDLKRIPVLGLEELPGRLMTAKYRQLRLILTRDFLDLHIRITPFYL